MSSTKTLGIVILVLLLLAGFTSIYTVTEGENALLLRLGKIEKNPQTGLAKIQLPGLHFKIPFVEKVRYFDIRLQTLDIKSSRIVTKEKKDVIVDYYVKWRIGELAKYFKATGGSVSRTDLLLEQQLNDSLRAEFGRRTIKEVIADDRESIMHALQKQADTNASNLGVTVVDVRIKRIDLPPGVSSAVYDRMRAERERVATQHRAEGKASAEAVKATADAKVTVEVAEAKAKGAKARASGDAKAARIYAKAYKKDPEFYAFYRSLKAYRQTFDQKNDILVLRPNSQFFDYFNQANVNDKKKS